MPVEVMLFCFWLHVHNLIRKDMLLVVGQCHVCVFTYAVIYTVVDLVSHGIVVVSVILLFMPTLITLHY